MMEHGASMITQHPQRRSVITGRWWWGFGALILIGLPGALAAMLWGGDMAFGFIGTLPVFAYVIVTIVALRRHDRER